MKKNILKAVAITFVGILLFALFFAANVKDSHAYIKKNNCGDLEYYTCIEFVSSYSCLHVGDPEYNGNCED